MKWIFAFVFPLLALHSYDVLSLSDAMMDHLYIVEDTVLEKASMKKGGWALIDGEESLKIGKMLGQSPKIVPGGSGVNVMKGLSALGHKCAVLAKVGRDEMGKLYRTTIEAAGIVPLLKEDPLPTGQILCFITPDGERTFRVCPGACGDISNIELKQEEFSKAKWVHIDGYQVKDTNVLTRALKMAKAAGAKISYDLGNLNLVKENRNLLWRHLAQYIDVLFCNEMEAHAMTGKDPEEACGLLSSLCDVAVVTMSEKGSWVQSGKQKIYTPAKDVPVVDTTGAGDLFSSGFLHAYIHEAPLEKCAQLGTEVASEVIQVIGAEIPPPRFVKIRKKALLDITITTKTNSSNQLDS